jgi:hypothetical protein
LRHAIEIRGIRLHRIDADGAMDVQIDEPGQKREAVKVQCSLRSWAPVFVSYARDQTSLDKE